MISLVIPVFNEEKSLLELYQRITRSLKDKEHEIIFVNDGSTDGSEKVIEKLTNKDKKVSFVSFRRNQGKSRALMAGFNRAKGETIVTLDADLQDRPEEIIKLLKKLDEGYDLVSGWKKKRNDPALNVIFSRIGGIIISKFAGVELHDINCGLKAYKKEVTESLTLYGDLYRFIPVLASAEGFSVGEVEVTHDIRKYGRSKYGPSKFFRSFFDLFTVLFLTKFKTRPFHLFGALGTLLFFLGGIILGYLSILWFSGQAIGRRPLLILGILLVIIGIQLFTSGLLAELLISLKENKDGKNQR